MFHPIPMFSCLSLSSFPCTYYSFLFHPWCFALYHPINCFSFSFSSHSRSIYIPDLPLFYFSLIVDKHLFYLKNIKKWVSTVVGDYINKWRRLLWLLINFFNWKLLLTSRTRTGIFFLKSLSFFCSFVCLSILQFPLKLLFYPVTKEFNKNLNIYPEISI